MMAAGSVSATVLPCGVPAANTWEVSSSSQKSSSRVHEKFESSNFFGRSELFPSRFSPCHSASNRVLLFNGLDDAVASRVQSGNIVHTMGPLDHRRKAFWMDKLGNAGGGPSGPAGRPVVSRYKHSWRHSNNQSQGNFSRIRTKARLGGDGDRDINGESIVEDYYSVLGLTPDATPDEIKKSYYSCMKACHPDLTGNAPSITDFCKFVNEVYEVLSDPEQRMIYDEINGFTITAINPFKDTSLERDHAFVDEFTCIGCKNCAHTAPVTFEMEEIFGRARVMSQDGQPGPVNLAIETCPVDCIHWVTAPQLTLLEDEMRVVERVNVGVMLSGMGRQPPDIFTMASWKWEKRQQKAVERARVRMMKEGGKKGVDAWWNAQWGSGPDDGDAKAAADKYSRERAIRTAAAARRWREYSRQGVDRRAARYLAARAGVDIDEEEEFMTEKTGSK